MSVDVGIQSIQKWIHKQESHSPVLIAIAGGSCAGKSTIAQQIFQLSSSRSQIISLDDFYKDIRNPNIPYDGTGNPSFDHPDSYDRDQFCNAIKQLMIGNNVNIPVYDLNKNWITGQVHEVNSKQILIAEGLYAIQFLQHKFHPNLSVYIEATQNTRIQRRVQRDSQKYHMLPAVIEDIYQNAVLPYHLQYVEMQRAEANLIIQTD